VQKSLPKTDAIPGTTVLVGYKERQLVFSCYVTAVLVDVIMINSLTFNEEVILKKKEIEV
jgi:hypothetical protein